MKSRNSRLVEALDALYEYIDSGFTNVGDAGENVTMILLLFACRAGMASPAIPDRLSFPLVKLEDFLSNFFLNLVDLANIPSDCHLRFSSYYSLDAFADDLSPGLLKVSLLLGQAIKSPPCCKGIDLVIPIYCKATKNIGCIEVQCKSQGSNLNDEQILKIHA